MHKIGKSSNFVDIKKKSNYTTVMPSPYPEIKYAMGKVHRKKQFLLYRRKIPSLTIVL